MAMRGSKAPDLEAMFKNHPIGLWVEDPTTEVYLNTLWQTGEVGIFIAGGWANLEPIVENCQRRRLSHVFGYRDRDFSRSNRASWQDPSWQRESYIYKGDSLEVENLILLADQCIADCVYNTARISAAQVGEELLRIARLMKSWMACRKTLQNLREDVGQAFPGDPADWRTIRSKEDAQAHIVRSRWWREIKPAKPWAWSDKKLAERLSQNLAFFAKQLDDGSWRQEFSGKELLQALLPKVWKENERDTLEFVKAIAVKQREQNLVPAEVRELRESLRARTRPQVKQPG